MRVAVCISVLVLGASIGPSPMVPPENRQALAVGDPKGHPLLRILDEEVKRFGITPAFERTVSYEESILSGVDPVDDLDRTFAIVRYGLPDDGGEIENGVEVWIKRSTGRRIIAPKSVLRTAAVVASRAGVDLTQYRRAVERIGDLFYVTYSLRPRRPDLAVLDGSVTVVISAKTGKQMGKLMR